MRISLHRGPIVSAILRELGVPDNELPAVAPPPADSRAPAPPAVAPLQPSPVPAPPAAPLAPLQPSSSPVPVSPTAPRAERAAPPAAAAPPAIRRGRQRGPRVNYADTAVQAAFEAAEA